jgi:predicted PurR-regulated permease PerM
MAEGSQLTTQARFLGRVLIVALVAGLVLLAYALRHVLLLLFAAILIAVGLRGLAGAIEKVSPLKGKAALGAAVFVVLALLAGAGWLLGAQITAQITELIDRLPTAWQDFRGQLASNRYGAMVLSEIESGRASAGGALSSAASRIGGYTITAAGALLDVVVVVIAALFMMVSPQTYKKGVLALAPRQRRERLDDALDASAVALRKWLLGTLISMLFLAVTVTLGLWALGVPAPLALGLLAGLAQFVPLIGPILATVPGVLLALTVGPQTALWAAALYFVASQVEANLVYPIIQERAVSMAPVMTLFAVVGVGLLLGPLGAVLATPLAVVLSVFVVMFYVRDTLGDHETKVPGQ